MKDSKLFKLGLVAMATGMLLSAPAVISCTAFAEDNVESSTEINQTRSEILFRGIPWYSTKAYAEKILLENNVTAKEDGWQSDSLYRLSALNYPNVNSGNDRVDGGGIKMSYSGLTVAGYTPSEVHACYIYQIDNSGSLIRDIDNSQLYLAWYVFDGDDFTDYQSLFDDLTAKLSSLYGIATDDENAYLIKKIWNDSNSNSIQMVMDDDRSYVTLGYIASDADSKLDEMQSAIDAENAAAEAVEREKNATNTDGL